MIEEKKYIGRELFRVRYFVLHYSLINIKLNLNNADLVSTKKTLLILHMLSSVRCSNKQKKNNVLKNIKSY